MRLLSTADVEGVIYLLAPEFYPDYPDPMPDFAYLGGEQGKGKLESALTAPRQTWPLILKAARMLGAPPLVCGAPH